jgi:hypothetical protein
MKNRIVASQHYAPANTTSERNGDIMVQKPGQHQYDQVTEVTVSREDILYLLI